LPAAPYAGLSGKSNIGKSYVIFGKTDNTTINLSAIGTGGFPPLRLSAFSPLITKPLAKIFTDTVISCSALLPATSVNGDGLDDLIVGAWGAESKIGKSYVIFGKTDSAVINLSAIGTGGFVINGESVDNFTDTVISCSALLPATSVATMVTVSLCTDVCTAL
jgi:hypothetical protein